MSSPSSMVDWDLAGRTARRLISAGPDTTREEAAAVVRELHEAAAVAVAHVEGLTGLQPGARRPGARGRRRRPARLGRRQRQRHGRPARPAGRRARPSKQDSRPGALATAIGSRATGVQAGGVLAFLSSRVLGQYEVFGTGGRLLLVAPNIVATERKLGVDPSDFRLWVCLHEVTHQLQFTAVPVAAAATSRRRSPSSSRPPTSPPTCCASGCRTCCAASPTPSAGGDGELRGADGPDQGPRASGPSSTGSPR